MPRQDKKAGDGKKKTLFHSSLSYFLSFILFYLFFLFLWGAFVYSTGVFN